MRTKGTETAFLFVERIEMKGTKSDMIAFFVASGAVLLACLTGISRANDATNVPQEIIIKAKDIRGAPLRNAGRDFLTKLASGDVKGAKSMFAGPKDQEEFLDVCLAGVEASQHFRRSFKARFPMRDEAEAVGIDVDIRGLIRSIDVETFMRRGETASMSPGSTPFVIGLDFKLVNERWLVSSLTVFPKETAARVKFTKTVSLALAHMAKKVDDGDFKKPEDVLAAIKADLSPAYEQEQAEIQRAGK